MEKAYEKIAFSEAARMLFFESQKPMKQYAANVSFMRPREESPPFFCEKQRKSTAFALMFEQKLTNLFSKSAMAIVCI